MTGQDGPHRADGDPSAHAEQVSLEHAAIGIAHVTPEGRFAYANPRLCELLGYELHELVGKPVGDFTHVPDRGIGRMARLALLNGEIDSRTDEKRYLRRNGETFWVRRWLSLVRAADGSPLYIVVIFDDITDSKMTAERYRAIFENAAVGITQVQLDGMVVDVNDKLCEMLGYTRGELCGRPIRDITHPDDYEIGAALRKRIVDGGVSTMVGEKRFVRKGGEVIWARRTMSVVRDNVGQPVFIISVVEDVSERKRAEEALRVSERIMRATFSQAGVGIMISAPDSRILQVNDKYCEMLGRSAEEMVGMTLRELKSDREIGDIVANRDRLLRGEVDHIARERELVRKDGTLIWVAHSISLVRDAQGRPQHFVTVAQDIRERKAAEDRLTQLAHYDVLTNLPNRVLFYERLKSEVAQAARTGAPMAVFFIDVDRFKYVNDTLGHAAGDKLLQQVAGRLSRAVRARDTVGRLGGDEFAVVAASLKEPVDAQRVAQKIIAAFNDPLEVEGVELFVTASVGLTLCPADSTDPDVLIRNADAAMYRAKELGRNTFEFYAPDMNLHAHAVLTMGNELRRALERGEFLLHYQPKIELANGTLTGFEALLRWQRDGRELLMPGDFVPVLEETGLIVPVGQWVIEAACRQIAAWRSAGLAPVPVAVNLSPRQFRTDQLAAMVHRILAQTRVEPPLLQLEITESFLANRPEAVRSVQELAEQGVSIAIDDFGTGYSNLANLKRFAVDTIKIDRSFVRDIGSDEDDAAIVRAIINMAHSLGLSVVAEGVESLEQLHFLKRYGCDEVQGYYIAHPGPASEHAALLEAHADAALAADAHALSRRA